MTLTIGSRTKQANGALSTTNGQIVIFRYAVQAGDVDGDTAALAFRIEVVRILVSVADAGAVEGAAARRRAVTRNTKSPSTAPTIGRNIRL